MAERFFSIQVLARADISSRTALSVTIVKCQGCSFMALGAQLAAEMSRYSAPAETGSGLKSRTARRSRIACRTSII